MSDNAPTTSRGTPLVLYRFLSAFKIVCSDQHPQGRLVPCEGPIPRPAITGQLPASESHLEEWLSREPSALFAARPVLVLASQNYAHLGQKVDLLLVDSSRSFHVLELKAEPVARNGVTPDQIQGQMNRYVTFLRRVLPSFPTSLRDYYTRFTAAFLGSPHDLAEDFRQAFGDACLPQQNGSVVLNRTFVTEGYDDYAINYFRARQAEGDGPFRLVYYCFHPVGQRIEFWEILLTGDNGPVDCDQPR